jgi:O-antigen/teichoic acid export membrane protein
MISDEQMLIAFGSIAVIVWMKTANQQLPPTRIRVVAVGGGAILCFVCAAIWFFENHPTGNIVAMIMIGVSQILVAVYVWRRIPKATLPILDEKRFDSESKKPK